MEGDAGTLLTNQPIVIDNGTGVIKAGFAGMDAPSAVFNNFVGRPKHEKVMAGAVEGDHFIGERAQELRGLLSLSHPMETGIVTSWDDMERVWLHAFAALKAQPEQHPVLLTEAPLNPRKNRERAAEILFESFNVPSLYVSLQAVLALYASGRTTGVVLDSGDGVSHAVPVVEGFALTHSITRTDIAGRTVTRQLQRLMRKAGRTFTTSAEFEVLRDLKESACYVAFNPDKEESQHLDQAAGSALTYKLPDGNTVDVGPERFRAPELLFRPELVGSEEMGLHEVLTTAIQKSDLDLRKTLYQSIVLSGGNTMFQGFGDRLLNETRLLAPKDIKIRITAPPNRVFSTWAGGSLLASLQTFSRMLVTADQYAEEGASVINRRTF